MEKLTFNDFEKYDIILNDKNDSTNQEKAWNNLKSSEYISQNPLNSFCGGTMPKVFLRCNSSLLAQMFDALSKPDCSYVTYLNDFLKGFDKTSTPPIEKVSALLKKTHLSHSSDIEEVSAIIANALQVPTVYNKAVMIDEQKYTLSVDFIKDNETFTSLDNLMPYNRSLNDYSLEDGLACLQNHLSNLEYGLSNAEVSKLCEDFIPIYLFRKYIISDCDFGGKNLGVLYNHKTKTAALAPCFDFECSLGQSVFGMENAVEYLEEDLETCIKLFPKKTEKVMQTFKKALKTKRVAKDLKKSSFETDKKFHTNYIENNLKAMTNCYAAATKDSQRKPKDVEKTL